MALLDTPSGRAVVASNPVLGLYVLDREQYTLEWPFWGRYAIVRGNGKSMASTNSFEAAKLAIEGAHNG